MAVSMKKIREAILQNRGGLESATDTQIKTIWNALDEKTQHDYMTSIRVLANKEGQGSKDANSE